MTLRCIALSALVPLALAALGCSETPPPAAKGASAFSATSGGCGVTGGFEIPAGEAPTSGTYLGSRVTDGKSGAEVSCTVSPGSGGYEISGSVQQGQRGLTITNGVVTPNPALPGGYAGTGMIYHYDSLSGPLQTLPGQTCAITVGTDAAHLQDIASGRVWGNFVCDLDTVGDPATPSVRCSAQGHFVFENCDK
jgi:hypothetical protein